MIMRITYTTIYLHNVTASFATHTARGSSSHSPGLKPRKCWSASLQQVEHTHPLKSNGIQIDSNGTVHWFILIWLVVETDNPSEKYEFVNWDDDIPSIWENEKCSKPPASDTNRCVWFFSHRLKNIWKAFWCVILKSQTQKHQTYS